MGWLTREIWVPGWFYGVLPNAAFAAGLTGVVNTGHPVLVGLSALVFVYGLIIIIKRLLSWV